MRVCFLRRGRIQQLTMRYHIHLSLLSFVVLTFYSSSVAAEKYRSFEKDGMLCNVTQCVPCFETEKREPFCQDTGFREQVSCVVIDTMRMANRPVGQPIIAGKESLDSLVRIHYQSCSITAAQAKTFISFEFVVLLVMGGALYMVVSRKRMIQRRAQEEILKRSEDIV